MTFELVYRRDPAAVRAILDALPDWFGIPEANEQYQRDAASEEFTSLLAVEADEAVGAALIRRHFPETAEVHLIAVAPSRRHDGIGSALIERIAHDLATDGCRLLTVHTVGPSFEHEPYAATRSFYRARGFLPLEEHDGLDWDGPTLILVRVLAGENGPS